jgi:signal transduction histidine kinase
LSEDVHALSYALHPSILEDLGLIEALKAECARFGSVEGMPTRFRATDNVDEPDKALSLCLYRVAQEALRNAARHSSASSVEVELRAVGGELERAVRDDGVGFDPTRKQTRPSLGLAGMRQRLSLVDGELLIDTAPGNGTTIVARASLKRGGAP